MEEKRNLQKEGMLERLARENGCVYLSDLRSSIIMKRCMGNVKEIEIMEYSTETWRDAADYITGKRSENETAEEAKSRLLAFLEGI